MESAQLNQKIAEFASLLEKQMRNDIKLFVGLKTTQPISFIKWLDESNGVKNKAELEKLLEGCRGNLLAVLNRCLEQGGIVDFERFYMSVTAPEGRISNQDPLHMAVHFLNDSGELQSFESDFEKLKNMVFGEQKEEADVVGDKWLWDAIKAAGFKGKLNEIQDADKVRQAIQALYPTSVNDASSLLEALLGVSAKYLQSKGISKADADIVRGVFYRINKDSNSISKLEDLVIDWYEKYGEASAGGSANLQSTGENQEVPGAPKVASVQDDTKNVESDVESPFSKPIDGYALAADFDDGLPEGAEDEGFFSTTLDSPEEPPLVKEVPKAAPVSNKKALQTKEVIEEPSFEGNAGLDGSFDEEYLESLLADESLNGLELGDEDDFEEGNKVTPVAAEKPKFDPKSFDKDVDAFRSILDNATSDPNKLGELMKLASQVLEDASKDPERAKIIAQTATGVVNPKRIEALKSAPHLVTAADGSKVLSRGPDNWDNTLFKDAKTVAINNPQKNGREVTGFMGHLNLERPMLEIINPATESHKVECKKTPMSFMSIEKRLKEILKTLNYKLFKISTKGSIIDQCHFDTYDEMIQFISRVMFAFIKSDVVLDLNKKDNYLIINYRLNDKILGNALLLESL